MSSYIGIDLGTSSVKLLLTSGEGKVLRSSAAQYPVSYSKSGYSEQNPADWTDGVMRALAALLDGADASDIKAIAVGGQMHGLVMMDKGGQHIRPAILWNDGRTQVETDWLNSEIGKEKLAAYTGNIAFAGFTAPKLLWVAKNERGNFNKMSKMLLPKDYVVHYLSGEYATDVSDASGTLLFDVEKRDWSDEMLDICGMTREKLPKCYESYEVVGELRRSIADELGLPYGIKIIAGAGDNAAAAVGVGAVGDGKCNISLGTSGTIFAPTSEYFAAKNNAVHTFCHADGGWHQMGCMLSATLCCDWWAKDILGSDIVKEQMNSGDKLGQNDVYFLPYLMGERSPHNDTSARGAFIGMRPDTTRKQMTVAVLEGVAFGLRDSLECMRSNGLEPANTKICGGGSKSTLWRKIISNIMNLPVGIPSFSEGASYGAAILAMVGCGEYSTVAAAAKTCIETRELINPDNKLAENYRQRYNVFKQMYPALSQVFSKI